MKRDAIEELRAALQHLGCATRPALSAATGLSKVRVNQLVAQMLRTGELCELPQGVMTSGRPARQYAFAGKFAEHLLIFIDADAGAYRVQLDVLDAVGGLVESTERRYAHIQSSSFPALLEDYEGRGLQSVVLCLGVDLRFTGLRALVQDRCGCPLRIEALSTSLAERSEASLSIAFEAGRIPRAHYYSGGQLRRTGNVSLLPMPDDWEGLDYEDRTMLEEMVARLVLYLVCPLTPQRVLLFADCWNERLESRIRFNCSSKLREMGLPEIEFCPLRGTTGLQRLRLMVV
ncbi:MAG: hypothetical protein R3Y56_01925 [Akkermansia sp.]